MVTSAHGDTISTELAGIGRELKLLIDEEIKNPFELRVARLLKSRGLTEVDVLTIMRHNKQFHIHEPMLNKIANHVRDIDKGIST